MNTLSNKVVDTQELLPCPSGHTKTRRDNNNIYGSWWVKCAEGECSWRAAGDTEAEAIRAWNTRTTQCSGDTQELRAAAIAICKAEARELGYIDEDVADFDNPDGDDLLAVQAVERALRTTQCSGDTQELADPQVVVAGKLLTIKPGAPEIALLCRAIFRASFADDEDEALVNQKYQEWEEGRAKAIRAARFVLRALGGNGSVVRALRTTHSPSEAEECAIPPEGWRCTRAPGHEGPCAAIPATDDKLVDLIRDWMMSGDHPVSKWERDFAAAIRATLPLPSDKTVELLREARIAVDVLERSVRFGIPEEQRPDTSNARELLAKLDSHLGEMK